MNHDHNRMEKIILHAISLQSTNTFSGKKLAATCRELGLSQIETETNSYLTLLRKYCLKHPSKGSSWIKREMPKKQVDEAIKNISKELNPEPIPDYLTYEEYQMIKKLKATGKFKIIYIANIEL